MEPGGQAEAGDSWFVFCAACCSQLFNYIPCAMSTETKTERETDDSMSSAKAAAKKMSKTQLTAELAEATGTSKKIAGQFIESLSGIAYREAKKAGEFTIPGIGKLVKQQRKARDGRNPATGETIKIPAKTVIKFRVAKAAKDSVLGSKK